MSGEITFSNYQESGPSLLNDDKHKIQATFRIKPIHVTVANTLRRQILASVPTVGFKTEPPEASDVIIETNTTALVNEMISHRIGMIPINIVDPSSFDPKDYEFRINIENIGTEARNVTASDFTVIKFGPDSSETVLNTNDFFPPDPITKGTAIITTLRPQYNADSPSEKLVIRAKPTIGTGRQNMRYSCVSQCSYEYTIDDNVKRQNSMFLSWLAVSKKVEDPNAVTPERLGELKREFNCLEIQRCFLENEKGEPYDFIFHIESVGIFSVPTIIDRGLQACEDLVTPYINMDTDLPSSVSVVKSVRRMENGLEFTFTNEDHTLGNLLQTLLVNRHIEGSEEPRITYAGYKVPHPLRQEMVLILSSEDGNELNLRKAIASTCTYLKEYFVKARKIWSQTK